MKQFFASELAAMSEEVQAMLCRKVEGLTRDSLWNGEKWQWLNGDLSCGESVVVEK